MTPRPISYARAAAAAAALSMLLSCAREAFPADGPAAGPRHPKPFAIAVAPYAGEDRTKSWSVHYGEADGLLVDETVAVYDESGTMVLSYYFNYEAADAGEYDGLETYPNQLWSGELADGKRYTAYALVNSRGDRRSLFPDSEDGVASMVFDPGDPRELEDRGIPMAGSLSFWADSRVPELTLTVRRLYAKVHIRYPVFDQRDYTAGHVYTFSLFQLNRRLVPFGTGRALSPSDIHSSDNIYRGYDSDTPHSCTDGWFYVPENMQGEVEGILSPSRKSPDEDVEVSRRRSLLTYMETAVLYTQGQDPFYPISGTVYYRAYLGKNATTNFDVEGNCIYNYSLTVTEDGMEDDCWKTVNRSEWTRYRYRMMIGDDPYDIWPGEQAEATYTIGVGETKTYSLWRQPWRYVNGVLADEERPWTEMDVYRDLNRYVATVSEPRQFNACLHVDFVANGIRGVAAGDDEYAYFALNDPHVGDPWWNRTQWTVYFHVINTYSTMYRYVMEPEDGVTAVDIGDGVSVRIARYTDSYTNGTRTAAGTVPSYVSPSLFDWSSGDASVAAVSAAGGDWMRVTGVSGGTAAVTATLKSPSSSDANSVCSATFTVRSYSWGGTQPGDGGDTEIGYD